ncbi:putative spermidine/putrescine transport system ATP-binding protein [Palleronia aestuarii]|uniref:Putative spermidine/putrescine transport system ATP-binding protein n=1 Tax=Palleronia aestuarii TaxID=568105 RepID=A0A2W7N0K0_9RHOB|nr:ABC transporter ATP-binding protein [Palleronia aestuarii]PZX13471.1 putative spermidine/putrescine transport system ATP-binding protein [Palleronia aestuarii]
MAGLALEGVGRDYGATRAVGRVDLAFREGELTALLGPSGCGKTTLLRIIAGLEPPSRGRILLGGRDITAMPAHLRRFGMVFQSFALFPHLNVRDNVAYSLAISGTGRAARHARADELLDLVRLGHLGDRSISALSGGQKQRVAIARALAQDPEVFLLDEPMSALDAKLREEMQVELRLLQQRLGITTIVVTHDQREAMSMADRIVVMSEGRAEQVGAPQEIYDRPDNAFVAGFIGRNNFFDAVAVPGGLEADGYRLALEPGPAFRPGSPVRAACRPERIRLGQDLPEGNRLPARVVFVRAIGSERDVHVETPLGPFVVAQGSGLQGGDGIAAGREVALHLPPGALQVYPAQSRPREVA